MSDTLSISITPGYQITDGEVLTNEILRLIANPAVQLIGTLASSGINDNAVTTAKIADGALSADATGRGKMADLYITLSKLADLILSADATGRGKMADGFVTAAKLEETLRQDVPQYFAAASASGTTYVVTLSPAATVYTAGMVVRMAVDVVNTGASTVNVNGLGAKNIFYRGAALVGGELLAGAVVGLVYDGTQFQLQSGTGYRGAEGVVAASRGLVIASNVATPNSKADISADEVTLKEATTGRTYLASSVSLTVDMSLGVAVNGLDAGTEAASTWYYLWVIYNGTLVRGLVSTSATAPTLPAGYTYKALVGMVRNDGSSNFLAFYQTERMVFINEAAVFSSKAGVTSYAAVAGADLTVLQGLVPPIAKRARGNAGSATNGSVTMAVAGDASGLGAAICSASANNLTTTENGSAYDVPLKTAQTLYWKAPNTSAVYRLTVSGWVF